jgi:hypothetical protein
MILSAIALFDAIVAFPNTECGTRHFERAAQDALGLGTELLMKGGNANCSSSQLTRCRNVGYSDLRCRCSQGMAGC